ncbi:MAG: hypothetical protein IPP29_07920 [Bacteroidetes bacterium]|nr:hypothetical protein [Bacteroidota bacterium]MBL0051429.1 hypothetical protein [Bacteroidota bacterium]
MGVDDNEYYEEEKTGGSRRTVFIIIISILLGVNGLLLWQFFDKKKNLETVQRDLDETINDKDQLSAELQRLKIEYEKISQDNVSLQSQLTNKEEIIDEKISEIQHLINSGDATLLRKARTELENLRLLNQNYVLQIDTLKTVNSQLAYQNKTLDSTLNQTQGQLTTLAQQNKGLSERIAKANLLKSKGFIAVGVKFKKNGKEIETNDAADVEGIKINFTLAENLNAEKGKRDIYIRVFSPDGAVMANSSSTFDYKGEETLFTGLKNVDYENTDLPVYYIWQRNSAFSKGKYDIEIYCAGEKIDSTSVILK